MNMMTGATRLRNWRATKGLSQVDAAALLGASQASVHDWETGNKMPKLASAMSIEDRTEGAVPARSWVKPARRTRKRDA